MHTEKIFDENGRGFTRVFSTEKVEKVNPIEYYKSAELEKRAIILHDLLSAEDPFLASMVSKEFYIKNAEKGLNEFFEAFEKTEVDGNLLELLKTSRKKDQISLLKAAKFNPDELMSLIFKSYNDFGLLYSKYLFENLPGGLEGKTLPKMFRMKKDGTIDKVGETDLSDGELKNVIEHRKVIVSHFFENDELWHCFFITYNSIGGKENWKDGQAHFHYISSAFGIPKEEFIESMKSGKYKSTSVHIDLLDYGSQTS
jgi:hypothetical protein